MAYGFEVYNQNGFLLASDSTIKYAIRNKGIGYSCGMNESYVYSGTHFEILPGDLLFARSPSNISTYLDISTDTPAYGLVGPEQKDFGIPGGKVGIAVYKCPEPSLSTPGYFEMGSGYPMRPRGSRRAQEWVPFSGIPIEYFIATPISNMNLSPAGSGYGIEIYDENGKVILTSDPNHAPVNIIADIRTNASQWHVHASLGPVNKGVFNLPTFQDISGRKMFACLNNATPICRYSKTLSGGTGILHRCAFVSDLADYSDYGVRWNGSNRNSMMIFESDLWSTFKSGATLNFDVIKRSPKNFLVALM